MLRLPLFGLALSMLVVSKAQTINLAVVHDACGNGNGQVTAMITSGGNLPYTAEWSTGLVTSGDTLALVIDNLFAGIYTFTLTDALGTVFTESAEVLTVPSLQVAWSSAYEVIACDGGCTLLSIPMPGSAGTAGAPYSVGGLVPGAYNMSWGYLGMSALCANQTYDVVLSDAMGCSAQTQIIVSDEPSPNLLLQSITGSCAGDANGSATFQFDMEVMMNVASASGPTNTIAISYPMPGQVQVDGMPAGTYQFYASPSVSPTCFDTLLVEVPTLPAGCGTVNGTAFADLNGDCIQDGNEPGLPNRMITIVPTGAFTFTNSQGAYTRGMPLGAYAADIAAPGYDTNCPASLPAPFTLTVPAPDAQLDLAMTYGSGPDAATYLSATSHTPGFMALYYATAVNDGPIAMNDLTLSVAYDPMLSFVMSDSVLTAQSAGFVSWTIGTLPPFTTLDYRFVVQVPPDPGLIGTTLSAQCTISGAVPDADPSNDVFTLSTITIGAYDPNDKQARTSSDASAQHYLVPLDEHIDYTIRFQNTGTAPAQHVILIDTIAAEFDLGSFIYFGASHNAELSLLPGRVLRFDFPNIQLPDSASDPVGSNGYARFRLKPAIALPGTLYRNAADIYFDFNPPIRTNTSELMAMEPMHVGGIASAALRLAPNPASGFLLIETPQVSLRSIELLDPLGRLVLRSTATSSAVRIDVSALPRGAYVVRAMDEQGRVMHGRCVME